MLENLIRRIELRTKSRRTLLLLLDILFFSPISIAISFFLLNIDWEIYKLIFILYITLAFLIFPLSGQYRGITRFIGSGGMYKILFRNSIISLICIVFGNVFRFNLPPINFWITQWLLISVSLGFYRFLLRDVYLQL